MRGELLWSLGAAEKRGCYVVQDLRGNDSW